MAGRPPSWGRWVALLVAGVALASCSLWIRTTGGSQPPPSPYAGSWQDRTGTPVPDGAKGGRLVMVSFDGPGHCDWESVTFLQLAWPPGRVAASEGARGVRQYLRDPNGSLLRCRRAGLVGPCCPPMRATAATVMAPTTCGSAARTPTASSTWWARAGWSAGHGQPS
jgi:hypothetical protein